MLTLFMCRAGEREKEYVRFRTKFMYEKFVMYFSHYNVILILFPSHSLSKNCLKCKVYRIKYSAVNFHWEIFFDKAPLPLACVWRQTPALSLCSIPREQIKIKVQCHAIKWPVPKEIIIFYNHRIVCCSFFENKLLPLLFIVTSLLAVVRCVWVCAGCLLLLSLPLPLGRFFSRVGYLTISILHFRPKKKKKSLNSSSVCRVCTPKWDG